MSSPNSSGHTWQEQTAQGAFQLWSWRGEPVTKEEYARRLAFAVYRDATFKTVES